MDTDEKREYPLNVDSNTDGYQTYLARIKSRYRRVELVHSRVHEPEIHFTIRNDNVLFNRFPKIHRDDLINVNLHLMTLYDAEHFKVNCGATYDVHVTFKLGCNPGAFVQVFDDLIANEHYQNNHIDSTGKALSALRIQRDHYKATYKSFSKARQRKTLSYYKEDINSLQSFLRDTLKAELPSATELTGFGEFRFDPKMQFQHKNRFRHHLYPGCSSLSICIEAKPNEGESFCITNYKEEICVAIDSFIGFMDQSTKSVARYIHSINADYQIQEADQWFELKVSVQERGEKMVIEVSCLVSVLHYMFLMLYKFEEDEVRQWVNGYHKLIDGELAANDARCFQCNYQQHHVLYLDLNEKKLEKSSCIGRGSENHRFETGISSLKWRHGHDHGMEGVVNQFNRMSIDGRPRGSQLRGRGSGNLWSRARNNPPKAPMRIRRRGHIEDWNREKGFGWIRWDGNHEKCFVHHSHLPISVIPRFESLSDRYPSPNGTKVEFEIWQGKRGHMKAINVTIDERQPTREWRDPMRGARNPPHYHPPSAIGVWPCVVNVYFINRSLRDLFTI